ncbi:MAG: pyridoxal-phosphate dependent enzyme [Acidimicrobiia bacterium]|nr:pyridoxal-phosphate dependent enzyme [Acidimicrobiia bacterium]
MLGASWALYRALCDRLGHEPEPWDDVAGWPVRSRPLQPLTLVCATDGNHGRAVARLARWLGFGARIYVPENTVAARIESIEGEGASVEVVQGTYDDAVARSGEEDGEPGVLVISDTAWPGYQEIPRRVVEGYSTIFDEIHEELRRLDEDEPDVVVVQMGVGAFAASVVQWYLAPARPAVRIVGVEPDRAARPRLVAGRRPDRDRGWTGLDHGRPQLRDALTRGLAAGPRRLGGERGHRRRAGAVAMRLADGMESGESGAAGLGGPSS